MKRKKLKKYALGTSIKNYIENPQTALQQNNIDNAQAKFEGETDPLLLGMRGLGTLLMQKGLSGGGFSSLDGEFMANNGGTLNSLLSGANAVMAYGGKVPVEIEGGEVGEAPSGEVFEATGPNHEQGGVPVNLPVGTDIFSKRIKVDGVTIADRKKKRERKENKVKKRLDKNPLDAILKGTSDRLSTVNESEESFDTMLQEMVSMYMASQNKEYPYGTPKGGIPRKMPQLQIQSPLENLEEFANVGITNPYQGQNTPINTNFNPTFGDILGLTGNLVSTFSPYFNTLRNRAGDTPNINAFENFGERGLQTLDDSKQYVGQSRDRQLRDLNLNARAGMRSNRNSARGINTLRALDLSTQQRTDQAGRGINTNADSAMMQILANQAAMQDRGDQMIMSGEDARDTKDRQDRDNFYTNLAQNYAGIGMGLQETGSDLNTMKQREVMENLINTLSRYGITVNTKGNLIKK